MHLHLSESRHIAGDRPREQELFAYSLISWVLLPPPPEEIALVVQERKGRAKAMKRSS